MKKTVGPPCGRASVPRLTSFGAENRFGRLRRPRGCYSAVSHL